MIVCLCHRISDRDIVRVVREQGVTCFELLQDETHVASSCGCCHDCALEVFNAACAKAQASQQARQVELMPIEEPIRG